MKYKRKDGKLYIVQKVMQSTANQMLPKTKPKKNEWYDDQCRKLENICSETVRKKNWKKGIDKQEER